MLMPLDLEKLNKEQKEAVLHDKGPLLIVAGAGTGKTTVITQRIVNLIEKSGAKPASAQGSGGAKPEEILAVTFTEKAAAEMEERVDKLLDIGYVDLWISTFHSFCEKVLRENALDIGLSPDFKILDSTSGWLLARQNLDKFALKYYKALGNPTKFIQALISHFSHCKDQEVYPENYLEYAELLKTRDDSPEAKEIERIKEVSLAYHTYQKILLDNNCLDFGDLINYCLKLFKQRPLILKRYQEKFKYILVDEFQDTNWSQYELIKFLSAPKSNLTVCADDDQAIYRWRGASFSNIMNFKKDFPKAKQISLINNYRSSQNILDKAYAFIKQNDPDRLEFQAKISKKLQASPQAGIGIIEHLHAKNLDEETGLVIKKILEIMKKDKDVTYNDFAVLARANDSLNPFCRALDRAGLPYQFLASRGLYSKPIILDVISYFKLLDNYHEGTAVFRILNLPVFKISENDIAKLTLHSRKRACSLFEAMQEMPQIPGVINILNLVKKHSKLASEKPVSEVLIAFLEDSGYLKYLVNSDQTDKLDLLNQFLRKIKKFEDQALDITFKNFMQEFNLELESGEEGKLEFDPEQGPEMIKVMTIHGAKGLEFKYVFLVGMVDKRFPTIERKDPIELPDALIKDIKPLGDVHLQEERRLCYVAMTRAKNGLYFTSAEDYGGAQKKKISRFLAEMGYCDNFQFSISNFQNGVTAEKIQKPIIRKKIQSQYLPEHFSYSQLAAFEKCPLQYKFAFILKVPVRGKAVFSFGKTMHNTLHEFLKIVNEDKKQENLFNEPSFAKASEGSLENLNKIFERKWIDEWYESKKQRDDYYKLGKKIIKEFYEKLSKEKPNILKINNEPALELPFNLKVGEHVIYGVIDRIDEEPEGITIIDYKTGESKEKPEKDQLLIYQMAAEQVLHLKPKQLAYYYLDDGKIASFLGSEKDLQELKDKILDQINKIKDSQFEPTPGWQCQYCDFKDICDYKV